MKTHIPLLFAGAFFFATGASPAPPIPAPIVVPLHVDIGRGGEPRLGIDVTIGSSAQRMLFDTGSAGLRVIGKSLPPDSYRATGQHLTAVYGFGFEVRGEEALATVSMGAARATNMVFHMIDAFGCAPNIRDCPDNEVEPSLMSGIYSGIFGAYITAARKGCCVSPLFAVDGGLGRRYILHAAFDAPSLTLNPDASGIPTFSVVDFEAIGGPRGCIRIYGAGQETCGPVIFDSGTPQLLVTTTGMVPARPWSHATLRIGGWTHDFLMGSPSAGGVPLTVHRDEALRIVVGLMALQDFDVYFDLEHRRIGIIDRKR